MLLPASSVVLFPHPHRVRYDGEVMVGGGDLGDACTKLGMGS